MYDEKKGVNGKTCSNCHEWYSIWQFKKAKSANPGFFFSLLFSSFLSLSVSLPHPHTQMFVRLVHLPFHKTKRVYHR